MSIRNPSPANTERKVSPDPFALAAGMLRNDAAIVIPLLMVLGLPNCLELYVASLRLSWSAGLMAFDRLTQIAVVTYIAVRWRCRLDATKRGGTRPVLIASRIALVSLVSSFVIFMPLSMFLLTLTSGLGIVFLALFVAGCVWCLRVFFYFAAVSVFGMGVKQGLSEAIQVARAHPSMALKSLVSPAAFTLLFIGLALMPAPDGRSIVWTTIASVLEGVFWLLSTYTALGCALALFDDRLWRAAGLDQYRGERLATLQIQGGRVLTRLLGPRAGVFTLLVGLMFTFGNLTRQLTQPPSASVSVQSVTFADRSVRLELRVEDQAYHFRGLNIAAFSLATKTGFAQSERMLSASLDAEGQELLATLPTTSGDPRQVYLTFSTTKSADALRSADNLWLWYKAMPLIPVNSGKGASE